MSDKKSQTHQNVWNLAMIRICNLFYVESIHRCQIAQKCLVIKQDLQQPTDLLLMAFFVSGSVGFTNFSRTHASRRPTKISSFWHSRLFPLFFDVNSFHFTIGHNSIENFFVISKIHMAYAVCKFFVKNCAQRQKSKQKVTEGSLKETTHNNNNTFYFGIALPKVSLEKKWKKVREIQI